MHSDISDYLMFKLCNVTCLSVCCNKLDGNISGLRKVKKMAHSTWEIIILLIVKIDTLDSDAVNEGRFGQLENLIKVSNKHFNLFSKPKSKCN